MTLTTVCQFSSKPAAAPFLNNWKKSGVNMDFVQSRKEMRFCQLAGLKGPLLPEKPNQQNANYHRLMEKAHITRTTWHCVKC